MLRILFVCVQNAGRSQIAHAFAEQLGLEARSAGSAPATRVHAEVADAMQELGIDIRDRTPRRQSASDAAWADVVVTMGCGDACPYLPGRRYVDWELPDPHGMGIERVRAVRDEIRRRVVQLASQGDAATRPRR